MSVGRQLSMLYEMRSLASADKHVSGLVRYRCSNYYNLQRWQCFEYRNCRQQRGYVQWMWLCTLFHEKVLSEQWDEERGRWYGRRRYNNWSDWNVERCNGIMRLSTLFMYQKNRFGVGREVGKWTKLWKLRLKQNKGKKSRKKVNKRRGKHKPLCRVRHIGSKY